MVPSPRGLSVAEAPADRFAELVFHVLAHVNATASLAASVYDPNYVAFVEARLGPAHLRALGEDAALLGRLLTTHDMLASAQLLAWTFASEEQAERARGRDLVTLAESDVADSVALAGALGTGPAAEVLRAAAELEGPYVEVLPERHWNAAALRDTLRGLLPCAPWLGRLRISGVRALGLRGRVYRGEIWVGMPGDSFGPTLAHAAFQACHEATVAEVSAHAARTGTPLADRTLEQAAIVLFAARAARAKKEHEHAAWFAHFGKNAPSVALESLGDIPRAVVSARLALREP